MRARFELLRAERLIKEATQKLQLDLRGLIVLTEAGSNYFIYTPIIAYYAGARELYVWIKDTKYGKATDIHTDLLHIIQRLGIEVSVFNFALNERPEQHISKADIVTNLGFIRPIDKNFIKLLQPSAIVSYMCEAWEIRPTDVDIDFCKERNIPVAGVWENHPHLLIFEGCGLLSLKLCLEAGLEIYQDNILVISSDKFGIVASKAFEKAGAESVELVRPEEIELVDFSKYDVVFVADYSYGKEIIGKSLQPRISQLKYCAVIHLCGSVDYSWLEREEIFCYPHFNGQSSRMTKTLAHLGLKPLIDLHAAGLKVGESLFHKIENELVQLL
jgi:hypothetical protein